MKLLPLIFCLLISSVLAESNPVDPADARGLSQNHKTSFTVHFKGEESSYNVLGVPILPSADFEFSVTTKTPPGIFTAEASSGSLQQPGKSRWRWTAPAKSGVYPVKVTRAETGETMTLNLLVMVPFSEVKNGWLKGYRIGEYQKLALKGLSIYERPKGFIEVTAENRTTRISPHLTLQQFLCKQEGSFPKFLVLKERLLLKLESLIEEMEKEGISGENLVIMSGYRTPFYNKAIQNVDYSMHVYGGAADIYVDNDRNGDMDDLNKDGKVDRRDADVLYALFDRLYGLPWYERFIGGLGKYKRNQNHGPFVHVDVRGFRARWG